MSRLLERLDGVGRALENASLVVLLGALIALAATQIFMRNVLDSGFAWADELLRILVLWVAMLGAVAASRDRHHITIDILARVLPGRARLAAEALVDVFTCAIAALLAWHSARFVAETYTYGDRIIGDLPAWVFQAILPFAFGLIAWRYLVLSLARIRDLAAP